MAEPTCVMHAFSYAPVISNEAAEVNSVYDLEESVSLGKFMSESESLSWEKWSTFSRNRYVEEAEKFSKPGSVKQKKAYFEAHFKRMAALKAAALLEQANAPQGEAHDEPDTQPEVYDDLHDQTSLNQHQETKLSGHEHDKNDGQDQLVSKIIQDTYQEGTCKECITEFKEHNDGNADLCGQEEMALSYPSSETDQLVVEKEADNSGIVADNDEYNPCVGEDDLSTEVFQEADQAAQEEPNKYLINIEKQNPSTEMESGLANMKESWLKRRSISQNTCASAALKNKRNPALPSYMLTIEAAKSVAKPPAVHPGKENSWTPVGWKSRVDDSDKKRTPLRMSINRELNRLISPVIKKIGGSLKASKKDSSTPLRTPLKESAYDRKETSPQSGRTRARALFDSSGCGSKAAGPRWEFLSEGGANSPCSRGKKATTPTVPKSFGLSDDKVPRRKEKLEEKFNAKATENLQQQSKLKEIPKEVSKLRQSFCFGAKTSSDSFREKERMAVPSEKSLQTKVTAEQLAKNGRSRSKNTKPQHLKAPKQNKGGVP